MKQPKDITSEYEVLAGMLNNKECMYEGIANATGDFFTEDLTIKLFHKIEELSSKGLTTAEMIKKHFPEPKEKHHIDRIDGCWKEDIEYFKRSLHDLKNIYLKRCLYSTMNKGLSLSQEKNAKADDIITLVEREIGSLFFEDTSENIIDPNVRAIQGALEFAEKVDNPDQFKGIGFAAKTESGNQIGFPGLDQVFNGAHGGDLIMLAARTGEGKTAFAVNLARLFSLTQKYAGYYQNTEMKVSEMESRLLSPIAKVPAKQIFFGTIEGSKEERAAKTDKVLAAYNDFKHSKLFLSRIPSLPLHKSKGLARQFRNRYKKLDYMIVDYVGRMDLSSKQGMQQWDVLAEIMKQLKELAMELDIPIFVLAQRNQAGDVEGAKKMMNECDGVLYFEPVGESDKDYINQTYLSEEKRKAVNYKIVKRKVRRDDNPYPIYCNFDKTYQFINEVRTD